MDNEVLIVSIDIRGDNGCSITIEALYGTFRFTQHAAIDLFGMSTGVISIEHRISVLDSIGSRSTLHPRQRSVCSEKELRLC